MHKVAGKYENLAKMLRQEFDEPEIEEIWSVVNRLPVIQVQLEVKGQKLNLSPSSQDYVTVRQNSEVTVSVTIRRKN